MAFNYDEFYHKVNVAFLKDEHYLTYGQFIMNYLSENHPGVFIGLPPDCDCFYDNSKIPNLLNHLAYNS